MPINKSEPKFQFSKLERTILTRLGFVKKGKDFIFKNSAHFIRIACDEESGNIDIYYSSRYTNFRELENYDEASDMLI